MCFEYNIQILDEFIDIVLWAKKIVGLVSVIFICVIRPFTPYLLLFFFYILSFTLFTYLTQSTVLLHIRRHVSVIFNWKMMLIFAFIELYKISPWVCQRRFTKHSSFSFYFLSCFVNKVLIPSLTCFFLLTIKLCLVLFSCESLVSNDLFFSLILFLCNFFP